MLAGLKSASDLRTTLHVGPESETLAGLLRRGATLISMRSGSRYARGHRIQDVAHLIGASPASIYGWMSRYRKTRRVEALMDAPRPGRPSTAAGIPDEVLAATLQSDADGVRLCGHRLDGGVAEDDLLHDYDLGDNYLEAYRRANQEMIDN